MYLFEVNSASDFEHTVRALYPKLTDELSSEYMISLYRYLSDELVVNDLEDILRTYQELSIDVIDKYLPKQLRDDTLQGRSIATYIKHAVDKKRALDHIVDIFSDTANELGIQLYGTAQPDHFIARTQF